LLVQAGLLGQIDAPHAADRQSPLDAKASRDQPPHKRVVRVDVCATIYPPTTHRILDAAAMPRRRRAADRVPSAEGLVDDATCG
jgi:hypothetical protein